MSVAAIVSEPSAARRARRRLGPFLTQESLRLLRSRTALLIWAMLLYALLALPFLMPHPPPALVHAMATWLGSGDVDATMTFPWRVPGFDVGDLLARWLPTLPESLDRFFARVLGLEGWPAIVVANDCTGRFVFVSWLGVFDALTIAVVPREVRYLDVLLSTPLTRRAYMAATLLPILLVTAAIGGISAAVHGRALPAAGLTYDRCAYAGAAAVIIGWTGCLVGLVKLLILPVRDTSSALRIAFIPALASMCPGMLYMYRPDVCAAVPAVRDVVVFPRNLVWYPQVASPWGPPLAALVLGLAIAFAALAGWSIERGDVR